MAEIAKNTEKNIVLIQLQRKRAVVGQLLRKLESYRFAPKTYSLFEKKENLKSGLGRFVDSTEELLGTLKMNDIKVMNYIDDVERQFEKFNSLHLEMEDYAKVVQYQAIPS